MSSPDRAAPRPALVTIDDNPNVSRAVARDLRRRYGDTHRIVRADSGEQALEALRQMKLRGDPVAVLLADYRMPRMSGLEFLEAAMDLYPGARRVADREDEVVDWFDRHGIGTAFEMAATFVQAGIDVDWLNQVEAIVDDGMLEGALRWLNYTLETELLMNEIEDSATRISSLVSAAKQYSQLDRAPHQVLDVHELLESTLVMMSGKIGDQVEVVRNYDRTLPDVPVYGAELNQVWTNLIDNALQAMGEHGTLTLRTRRHEDSAEIEIGDTGPGIAPEIVSRIYEPFFTTKPVGQVTGLGLDISWRIVVNKHHGDLSVRSEPGNTRFLVRLPLRAVDGGGAA